MKKTGPRANREIETDTVQLIDAEGENRGPTPTREALAIAQEAGLDLVEIVPTAKPPVAKILDLAVGTGPRLLHGGGAVGSANGRRLRWSA